MSRGTEEQGPDYKIDARLHGFAFFFPGRVTPRIMIYNEGNYLGEVRWYAQWRRYVFSPNPGSETVFDPECLRSLARFCEERTEKHKQWRAKNRERR